MKRLLPAFFSLIIILGCVAYLYLNTNSQNKNVERSTSYIASDSYTAQVYRKEGDLLYEYQLLTRGTAVTDLNTQVEVNDGEFLFSKIELDGEFDERGNPVTFYIASEHLAQNLSDVVQESTKYVRTSVTVYQNDSDSKIASFLKKGSELTICGYSGLQEDGSVEMYKVRSGDTEGYVYSKYLTDTQSEALEAYSPISEIHAGRSYNFELYGGSTETLDWYPVEKTELSSGSLLEDAKAIYLNASAVQPDAIDAYITLALDSGANAFVVDIKDGILTYESDVAAELSPSSYSYSFLTKEQFSESMEKIKNAGLYVIGRIVVFNDDYYAADHPDECIVSDITDELWPSAYSRNCWYYNVALAQEAVQLFGFNEIQFDYVRFPESAYSMSESAATDFKNTYDEEKAEAIQNFCFYAADQMHRVGAYISVDVFGECVGEYVTAYGQYWPAISNVVDAISGMPYTDHFGEDVDTWSDPYQTVYEWAEQAAIRQIEIKTPAVARTWITGYDTPNWDPVVTYGPDELIEQVQALKDAGLNGGFIPWNGASDLEKYYSYSNVWSHQY